MIFFAPEKDMRVGDRVKFISHKSIGVKYGETGTVLCIYNTKAIGVCWDEENPVRYPVAGCKDKHGWNVVISNVRKIL